MKNWLRKYLGLDDLQTRAYYAMQSLERIENQQQKLRPQLEATLIGIGRVISKIEPLYAQSENPLDNPERKAESDKLGQEAINRLIAESMARHHTQGDGP